MWYGTIVRMGMVVENRVAILVSLVRMCRLFVVMCSVSDEC